MDEEKNGTEVPEDAESPDVASNNDEAQDDNLSEQITPEEKEMLDMAGESLEDMNADESADDAGKSSEEADNAEPSAPAEEGEAADDNGIIDGGSSDLLSQEDIDAALGDVGDQLETPEDTFDSGETDVKQADFQQLSASQDGGEPRNIELLMDVDLPVSIELGRTKMRISDILALGPGSIVELDKLVGEPVDLLVNQKCVARGEVVVVEESFGLRITQLVTPEERLKNLQ